MGIAIESRQPEYSSKSESQDFASYRLQLGDEPRIRLMFEPEDMPVLAAANYLARSMSISSDRISPSSPNMRRAPRRVCRRPYSRSRFGFDCAWLGHAAHSGLAGQGYRFASLCRHR